MKPREIAGSERMLLAVVLIEQAMEGGAPAPDDQALRVAIGRDGGKIEQLEGGARAVVIEAGQQVASDQAARAAHCALAIRAIAPDRVMAIAMGQADPGSKLPTGAVLERAAQILA